MTIWVFFGNVELVKENVQKHNFYNNFENFNGSVRQHWLLNITLFSIASSLEHLVNMYTLALLCMIKPRTGPPRARGGGCVWGGCLLTQRKKKEKKLGPLAQRKKRNFFNDYIYILLFLELCLTPFKT